MTQHDRTLIMRTAAWAAVIVSAIAGVALLVLDAVDGRIGEQSIFGMVLLGSAAILGSALTVCGQMKQVADVFYEKGLRDGRKIAHLVDTAH